MRDVLFVKHLLPEDEEVTTITYTVIPNGEYAHKAQVTFDVINSTFTLDNWDNLGSTDMCMMVLDELVESYGVGVLVLGYNHFELVMDEVPSYGDVLFHALYGTELSR